MAVVELQRRHLAVRVALQMRLLPVLAAAQIDGLLRHLDALLRHEHADDARIWSDRVVELHGAFSPRRVVAAFQQAGRALSNGPGRARKGRHSPGFGRHGAPVPGQNAARENPKISVRPPPDWPPVRNWQGMKVTKWSINSGELHVSEQSQTQDTPKAEASAAAPEAGQDRIPGDCARPRGAEGRRAQGGGAEDRGSQDRGEQGGRARHRGQDADHVARRPRLARRDRCEGRAPNMRRQAPLWRDGRGGGAGDDCRRGRRCVRDHGHDAYGGRGCDRARAGKWRAGSRDRTHRCRRAAVEVRPRSHLQDRADPVQQDQRSPRKNREGAGRAELPGSQNSPKRSRSCAPRLRPRRSSLPRRPPLSRRSRPRKSRAR